MAGEPIEEGTIIGHVVAPGRSTPVTSDADLLLHAFDQPSQLEPLFRERRLPERTGADPRSADISVKALLDEIRRQPRQDPVSIRLLRQLRKRTSVATVSNPLDMTGGASLQAGLMANGLRAMLEDDGYDAAIHPLLAGYRGGPKRDVAALADTLMCVSSLAVDYPEIRERNLNPTKIPSDGDGCVAVDYKVVVSSG